MCKAITTTRTNKEIFLQARLQKVERIEVKTESIERAEIITKDAERAGFKLESRRRSFWTNKIVLTFII